MVEKPHPVWIRFGSEVRRFRQLAGLSQAQLAKSANISPSMFSAIERGTRIPKKDFAEALDALHDTGGSFTRLWINLTNKEEIPDWFANILVLEQSATEIREYQTVLIPGLLQVEGYARSVIREGLPWASRDEVDRLVETRIKRHEVVTKPDGPLMWFVVDENALRRRIGTPEIMREQLRRVASAVEDELIRFQVIPQDAWIPHPGLSGPFRIMAFPDRPSMAYAEHMLGEAIIDTPEDVQRCNLVFGALQAEALSRRESLKTLHEVIGELS
ncbi:helix-turn-helix transcriptional regulator [Thermobifida halotolerans]|uniref:Helix-turn-helix transcriptional regulator n=1 Tax=Thermobifida halotolerans TaxID=483545 RepID=A0AA97LZ93_9ACTN|nr:helix-turn-helix transcriptional regulator [Thermobifida halotolerans]UOE20824.1 helix-turn-helix transcriptional regulator [Thermobifida halotolerans]